eukprot:10842866-Ditylum_brightwellii.AAC.1
MKSLDNALVTEDVISWIQRLSKLIERDANDVSTVEVLSEPKLDGLSLSLRYIKISSETKDKVKYELTWGATRGDGVQGEDVSDAALEMNCIPTQIFLDGSSKEESLPDVVEVRGEVILPKSKFLQLQQDTTVNTTDEMTPTPNATTEEEEVAEPKIQNQYSNARNAAS